MTAPLLDVANLKLRYGSNGPLIVDVPRLTVAPSAHLAITGASGAGKTSLAHLLCGIERPSFGSVRWGEVALDALTEAKRDRWRRRHVGLVFQDFHLVPRLSLENNILVTCYFDRFYPAAADRERARAELSAMGLAPDRRDVNKLSRGEQQRVALARATWRRPPIVIADEPTASLDAQTGSLIAEQLLQTAEAAGSTLIVVTHDSQLIKRMGRVITMAAGRIIDDRVQPELLPARVRPPEENDNV